MGSGPVFALFGHSLISWLRLAEVQLLETWLLLLLVRLLASVLLGCSLLVGTQSVKTVPGQ